MQCRLEQVELPKVFSSDLATLTFTLLRSDDLTHLQEQCAQGGPRVETTPYPWQE